MFRFFTRKKMGVKAVYEDDLTRYLKSAGLYDNLNDGKIRCKYCGGIVTFATLEIISPSEKGLEVVCSNRNCQNQI